jgi:hypothetical protein
MPILTLAARLERVHIDHLELPADEEGYVGAVIIVDAATGVAELVPVKSLRAKPIADAVEHEWIARYGPPRTLVTDNAQAMRGRVMERMLARHGIDAPQLSSRNHAANGQAERVIKTIKRSMRALLHGQPTKRWRQVLPWARWAYVSSLSAPRKASPFELLTGIKPHLPVERRLELHHDEQPVADEQALAADVAERTAQLAATARTGQAEQQAKWAEQAGSPVAVQVGDIVWLEDRDRSKPTKFDNLNLHDGPFRVVALRDNGSSAKLATLTTNYHLPSWQPLRYLKPTKGDLTAAQPATVDTLATGWAGATDDNGLSEAQRAAEKRAAQRANVRAMRAAAQAERQHAAEARRSAPHMLHSPLDATAPTFNPASSPSTSDEPELPRPIARPARIPYEQIKDVVRLVRSATTGLQLVLLMRDGTTRVVQASDYPGWRDKARARIQSQLTK